MNRSRAQAPDEKARALLTSRTIFVANIPYDVTEEQLKGIFSEVGPVQEFVLKFDQNTGRPKGFGFCHYFDHETALSAVRNLKDVHVSGRALRVELSTDEPGPKKNNPSNSAPNGNGPPNGNRFPGAPSVPAQGFQPFQPPPANSSFPANSRTQQPPYGGPTAAGGVQLNLLPPGQEVPPGERATDVISKTLASIPPGKLEEVLLGMKTMVKEDPEGAKKVFQQHPQLAYALFQAMLLMNAVDPSVLQRMKTIPPVQQAPPPQQAPVPQQPSYSAPQPPTFVPTPPTNQQSYNTGYGGTPNMYGSTPQPPVPQAPARPPIPSYGQPAGGNHYAPPPQAHHHQPPPQQQPPPSLPPQGNYGGRPPVPPYSQPPPQQPMQSMGMSPYGASAPPAPAGIPGMNPAITQALSMVGEDQRAMLMQVLSLTPDQISALPNDQRAGVMQLRSQFGM